MRVRLDDATAAQLREFYRTRYGGQIHETAGIKAVLLRLEAAGFDGQEIEVADPDDPPALIVDVFNPDMHEPSVAEKGVADLVAAGWTEEDAKKLIGYTSDGQPPGPRGGHEVEDRLVDMGYSRRSAKKVAEVVSLGELAELPSNAAEHWLTIRISSGGPQEPERQFVSVNGVGQFVPRGSDVQIRAPFLNVLLDAEEYEYDQIVEPDGRRTLRRHVVEKYPVVYLSRPRATKLEDLTRAA